MENNFVILQEMVQDMLDGEKKRREIALNFVNKVTNILKEVAEDIWEQIDNVFPDIIWLSKIKDNKKVYTDYYFRYKGHSRKNDFESIGFYHSNNHLSVWGNPLSDQRGTDFWYGMRIILEWLPQIIERIDTKQDSREKLLNLIK